MRIDVVTLFPEMFVGPLSESMLRVAQDKGLAEIRIVNLREYTEGRHRVADDYPFGGGGGMVLKPEPFFRAVEALRGPHTHVVLLCPQGRTLTQATAVRLAGFSHLILLCGHYEGVDERVRAHLADEEISIGDYVLTGGELPALVVMDAVVRLVPGVLGDPAAPAQDSFATGRLDYPHYTRPAEFRGHGVPDVLLSGDHERIARWRRREALRGTVERRPDLLLATPPSEEEQKWLAEFGEEEGSRSPGEGHHG
ncbi:MAG: tRNA (guanosine(37)-N1)-methyltransferase TrmD [Candidatus Rokubacteria bacterium]|nr:tRNA (guanosine(37)-N1)-methyltransferase TrmD [Candidatus Rokubacteria bacterium]